MTEYVCVDGPLAGETITSADRYLRWTSVTIEVVDVGQHPDDTTRFGYVVESLSTECHPGRLRFVGADGAAMSADGERQPVPV